MSKTYTASAGSKLEYSSNGTTWNRLYGLKNIPAIGEEPNKIDTTSLDNLKYETEIDGLMPAPKLNYEFNMEDPDVEANINVVHTLATANVPYYWRITRSNGIIHTYRSKVKYGFQETETNDIAKFTMYHSPLEEVVTSYPSTTATYTESEDTTYANNKDYYAKTGETYTLLVAGVNYTIGNSITGTVYELDAN